MIGRIATSVPNRRIVQAYRAAFSANATKEDVQLVLDDLEDFSGFLAVTGPSATDGETKYAEGQRSVFMRIRALTRISDETLDQIEQSQAGKDMI